MEDEAGKTGRRRMIDIEVELRQTTTDVLKFVKYIIPLPFELSPNQNLVLTTFYDPVKAYKELLLACGRKSFKTGLSGLISLFEIYKLLQIDDPLAYYGLSPGKYLYATIVATNEEQAKHVTLQEVRGMAEKSWYLSDYIVRETTRFIEFTKRLRIQCIPCSASAGRGYAGIINIYDEAAWYMQRSGMTDEEVFNSLQPNLRINERLAAASRTVLLSSPAGKQGLFWDLFRKGDPITVIQQSPDFGKEPWRCVFQVESWRMNTSITYESLAEELQRDPTMFQMEYGAQFIDVVSAALDMEYILLCASARQIDPYKRDKDTYRVITLDPATSGNAYGLMMGHKDELNRVKVDLVKRWTGTKSEPVNVNEVEEYVLMLYENFNVNAIIVDSYQSASMVQRFNDLGLPIKEIRWSPQYNNQAYQTLIHRINLSTKSHRLIRYPKDKTLIRELQFLVRKELLSSRTFKFEAAKGYSDDLCDCLASLIYELDIEQSQQGAWFAG